MTIVTDAAGLDLGRLLRRGDRIVMGQACGEPTTLVEALIAQGRDIGDVSAFIATSFSGLFTPASAESFALSSMGAIGALRSMTKAGALSVVPCHVSQVGPMIEAGIIGCDVAFVQLSPADAEGNHSFGLIADHVQSAVAKARIVVAEINQQVPFTYGETLPAARIDCAVHVSRPPVAVASAAIGETDLAIARHAAAYIGDGAVIQTGIGAVPDAILRLLHDRRDLGVHSGMLGDGLVELVEAGVVTNARKAIDTGVSINGALIGTQRLYDWAHHNPLMRMRADQLHARSRDARAARRAGDDQFRDGGRSLGPGQRRAERRGVSRRHRRTGRFRPCGRPLAGRPFDHRIVGDRQGRHDQQDRHRTVGSGDDRTQRRRRDRHRIWRCRTQGADARRTRTAAGGDRPPRFPRATRPRRVRHPAKGFLMSDAVLFDARDDGIAIITLNRPEASNALGRDIRDGLAAAWERFEHDPALRVAILTGAGDKAFCAGGDLKEMVDTGMAVPPRDMFALPYDTIELSKPTIAAVSGVAFAGGWMIAQACDLCVASTSARFCDHRGQGRPRIALGVAADPHDPAADHDGDHPHRKTDHRAARL